MSQQVIVAFDSLTIPMGQRAFALNQATGLIRSGKLTAVVSCCGNQGSFYFLSALVGEIPYEGTVVANGTPVEAPKYRRAAVLVDEDLTTQGELTVRQNLLYSAEMRLALPHAQIENLVENVIQAMDLEAVAKREVRACPPPVRRRVSIAKELVLDPVVLCVDGAIDGLATHEAKTLLHILRALAVNQNKIVVVSMVQPRWALLGIADDVVLIEQDKVVFCGESSALLNSTSSGSSETQLPESLINALYRTASSADSSLTAFFDRTEHCEAATKAQVSDFITRCGQGEFSLALPPTATAPTPWSLMKFFFLVKYAMKQVNNTVFTYVVFTTCLLLVAIVLAVIYTSMTGQSGMQNRIGIIFFLISSTFLHNILLVDQRKKEYLSYQRHSSHGYYGPITFLAYWVLTDAFLRFFMCLVFAVSVYSLANVESRWDYSPLRDFVAIVTLTSFSTSLLVWLVCCFFNTVRVAHFVLFAAYTFNIIVAGIILNLNTLPNLIVTLSFFSHVRLGYEAALLTQFTGQSFGCEWKPGQNVTATCYTGNMYLDFLGFKDDRKWKNVELMCIMSAVTIVLCYLTMAFRKSKSK